VKQHDPQAGRFIRLKALAFGGGKISSFFFFAFKAGNESD